MSQEEGSDVFASWREIEVLVENGRTTIKKKVMNRWREWAQVRDSMAGNIMICELMVKMHGRGRLLRGYELRKS